VVSSGSGYDPFLRKSEHQCIGRSAKIHGHFLKRSGRQPAAEEWGVKADRLEGLESETERVYHGAHQGPAGENLHGGEERVYRTVEFLGGIFDAAGEGAALPGHSNDGSCAIIRRGTEYHEAGKRQRQTYDNLEQRGILTDCAQQLAGGNAVG
jgi:hypothetical protein